jgi:hypothetical protein
MRTPVDHFLFLFSKLNEGPLTSDLVVSQHHLPPILILKTITAMKILTATTLVDLLLNIGTPEWTQRLRHWTKDLVRLMTMVLGETFWWIVALLKLQAFRKKEFKNFVQ